MSGLNVGVIGVGHLGRHHARVYHEFPHTNLMGIADIDQSRATAISTQYGVAGYRDFHDLLRRVEAVSVVVPTSEHYWVVKECLAAGVHVLVEKPIASTGEEGRELAELAQQAGLVFQVGHIERFNPVFSLVRPYIEKPRFIESHRLSPFQPRGTDVDVVRDLMVHDLDIILSLQLGPVQSIEASGLTIMSSSLDFANARIEFVNGCVTSLTASRVSPERVRKLHLFQEDAYLSIDYDTRRSVRHYRRCEEDQLPVVKSEEIQGNDEEPLKLELDAFIRSVKDASCPVVSADDGIASLELAERIVSMIKDPSFPSALSLRGSNPLLENV